MGFIKTITVAGVQYNIPALKETSETGKQALVMGDDGIYLPTGDYFATSNEGLSLQMGTVAKNLPLGTGLQYDGQYLKLYPLEVAGVGLTEGDGGTLKVNAGGGLQVSSDTGLLNVYAGNGLTVGTQAGQMLDVSIGTGLYIGGDNKIAINAESVGPVLAGGGLYAEATGALNIYADDSFTFSDGKIALNYTVVATNLKGSGLTASNGQLAVAVDNSTIKLSSNKLAANADNIAANAADYIKNGFVQTAIAYDRLSIGSALLGNENADANDTPINGLVANSDSGIAVAVGNGVKIDTDKTVTLNLGSGVSINSDDGKLWLKLGSGLQFADDGTLMLKLGSGFTIAEGGYLVQA